MLGPWQPFPSKKHSEMDVKSLLREIPSSWGGEGFRVNTKFLASPCTSRASGLFPPAHIRADGLHRLPLGLH